MSEYVWATVKLIRQPSVDYIFCRVECFELRFKTLMSRARFLLKLAQ